MVVVVLGGTGYAVGIEFVTTSTFHIYMYLDNIFNMKLRVATFSLSYKERKKLNYIYS